MADTDTERLDQRYREYDEVVEIVSAAEVWFTQNEAMAATVRHFERYPAIRTRAGEEVTPDFTVLFNDGTGIAAEIARLALNPNSFEALWRQLDKYAALQELPAGGGAFACVSAVDVLAFLPQDVANRACDLIEEKRQQGGPPHISVLSYGRRSGGDYDFIRSERANNPRPRGHGREPSLESWLADRHNADTLSGLTRNFAPLKAKARFCNDPMSELYLAVVLWSQVLVEMAGGERDLEITEQRIAEELRTKFGRGNVREVRGALHVLKAARLAVETDRGWIIAVQAIGAPHEDVKDVLLRRLEAPPRGPITHAEKERLKAVRRERQRNRQAQARLEVDE